MRADRKRSVLSRWIEASTPGAVTRLTRATGAETPGLAHAVHPSPWALAQRAPARPALALAPMEGVSDAHVRELLSGLGSMDACVTEFVRVTDRPVSRSVLARLCPELMTGGRTSSGTVVIVQLLGGSPDPVAESARRAHAMGALAIDLNFGCPARRVNGRDGGAALLLCPERLTDIVSATREAVPRTVPVSAKIRLGYENPDDVLVLARAAETGGAAWVTIHGRTKIQMYGGHADWVRIGRAREAVGIPVVANGDVVDPGSLRRCLAATGAGAVMIGRGAFRTPNLFRWLRGVDRQPWTSAACVVLLREFITRMRLDPRFRNPERAALARLKQWVRAMAQTRPDLQTVFQVMKRTQTLEEACAALARGVPAASNPASFLQPNPDPPNLRNT